MVDFEFSQPTKIMFGETSVSKVGAETKKYADKALVIYGGESAKKNGSLDAALRSLEAAGVSYVLRGGVQPNPRVHFVREAVELGKKENVGLVLAVGGGSCIDAAKGIALGIANDGDVWDEYYMQRGRSAEKALPVGSVLTIPAAGSETSVGSVVTYPEKNLKRGFAHPVLIPKFAAIDPRYHLTLPRFQTAAGVCDMMIHMLERYFVHTRDIDFTDRLIEAACQSLILSAERVMRDPSDLAARAEIAWIGTIAHNNLCECGRTHGDWASHLIAQELAGYHDTTHGACLSVIFPTWMEYVYKEEPGLFAQFAVRVMGARDTLRDTEHLAREGIRLLREFFGSMGLPLTLREAGVGRENLEAIARGAATVYGSDHIGKLMPLYEEDVKKILTAAAE